MNKRTLEVKTRQFTESSVEEFKCLLSKESLQDVFKTLEVNATLQVFTNTFHMWVCHVGTNGLLQAWKSPVKNVFFEHIK